MYKEIIILAKSTKRGGYCVAGVDRVTGQWIRPISMDYSNEGTVPLVDIIYSNGERVEIFDIVRINLISHNPTKSQPENYIYDDNEKWHMVGKSSLKEVVEFRGYDNADKIFYNTNKSVAEYEIGGQPSLLLLKVMNSTVNVVDFYGKRKLEFKFEYNGDGYNYFSISDEAIRERYLNTSYGSYNYQRELTAVFSLTDKYQNDSKYYKMVAQLFYD